MYISPAPPTLAGPPRPALEAESAVVGAFAAPGPAATSVSITSESLDIPAGHPAIVRGRLLAHHAGPAGAEILMQEQARGGWTTVAGTRTVSGGRFVLRYLPRHVGSERVRVRFAGAPGLGPARRGLGRLKVYGPLEARRDGDNIPRRFEVCVIDAESGGNRYSTNGSNWSYYQWTPETYNVAARMAGLRERTNPTEADLREQTKAFRAYEPTDPGAWPTTVPMCEQRL